MVANLPETLSADGLFGPVGPEGMVLAVLKELGGPCEVSGMPSLLMKRFGFPLPDLACLDAIGKLADAGSVRWDRDPTSLVEASLDEVLVTPQGGGIPAADTEAALMIPLGYHLETTFKAFLKAEGSPFYLHKDTSTMGPKKGIWRRPDFIAAHVSALPVSGRTHLDVHSFELKKESGCTVQSVYETLSQTRFTHYGHLVWHLPPKSIHEYKLAEIVEHCVAYDLGLVRMTGSPGSYAFETKVYPKRKPTSDPAVEEFLLERLSLPERAALRAAMRHS